MTDLCPQCGQAFLRPIIRDGFNLSPHGSIIYDGAIVSVSPQEGRLLYTVANSLHPIPAWALGGILSSSQDPSKLTQILLTRLRAKLKASELPFPCKTIRNLGIYWDIPA